MRHAQRAVSIDNISFLSCALDDKHSTSSSSRDTFSTLNGTNHHKNNIDDDLATMRNGSGSGSCSNNNNINNSLNHKLNNHNKVHASTDNLHKNASDDEQENIIPWRAQLRKTNSRLSLVG